jgi:putative heme transporter
MRWKECWWPSGQRRDGLAAAVLMLIEELRVELPGQPEQAEDVEIRERDDRGEEEYERRAEGMHAEQAAAIAVEISTDRHKEGCRLSTKADAPVDAGTGS